MDNKDYLEHTYKTNYDSAVKFVQYNNLPEAKKAFKRSLEAAIRDRKSTRLNSSH